MNSCILCKSSKKDDIQYGEFLQNKGIGVHTFCLYLSSNLSQNGNDDEGFLGFLKADIENEVRRISLLKCCYCSKRYANIGCCEKKCRRTFHLICGLDHNSQHQFSHDFRSFCNKHAKKLAEKPSLEETCLICYELLRTAGKKFNSFSVVLTPCCRNGWFHKICLQKLAKAAGYFFKCPLCNDAETFREELPAQGIFIPNQDAAWELEPNAFAELLERPNECCAQGCKNRRGRKASTEKNPFLMCITCGSKAIHTECLSNDVKQFYCTDCAVVIEEGDSGRESVNSHANGGNNENDYIDVCHVSDEEDVEISNKESEQKRDSGTHTNTSGDEMAHTTRYCNKTTRISKLKDGNFSEQQIRVSSDSNGSEAIKPVALKQKRRINSDSSSSEDTVPYQNRCRKTKRYSNDSSGADASEDDSIDSYVIKPVALNRRRRISCDSSGSDVIRHTNRTSGDSSRSDATEAVASTQYRHVCGGSSGSDYMNSVALRRTTRIRSGSSHSDAIDAVALIQKRRNSSVSSDSDAIKLVALRQKRLFSTDSSASDVIKPVALKQKRRLNSDSSSSEDEVAYQDKCRKTKRCEKNSGDKGNSEINKRKAMTDCKVIPTSPDIFDDSESDCERMSDLKFFPITQEGSHYTTSENSPESNDSDTDDPLENISLFMEKKNNISVIASRTRSKRKGHINHFNISAIGLRTRSKTICGITEYNKLLNDMPLVCEKGSEQDVRKEMKSSDISPIANRTRRRTTSKSVP